MSKTLRNPSEEELKELQKNSAAAAIPLHNKKTPTKSPEANEVKSFFEPAATPFKLPSGDLIIAGGAISMRRMTTLEEGLFYDFLRILQSQARVDEDGEMNMDGHLYSSFTKNFLATANAAIDNCIKSNVSVYDLSVLDQVPLFLNLLGITYGFEHDFDLQCPVCSKTSKMNVNIKEIPVKYYDGSIAHPFTFETTSFEFPVELVIRYLRISDESVWNDAKISLSEKYLTLLESASGVLPDGNAITEEHYSDIITNLNEVDKAKIKDWLNTFSEFGSDLRITKKFCLNKECSKYKKPQEVLLPIENIFQKVFNAL